MNVVTLSGNLTKKPELKSKGDKQSTIFNLAVSRSKDEVDFIFCCAYGKTAEAICNYLDKGSKVIVSGSIQTYQKDNITNYFINVRNAEFMDRKKAEANTDGDLPFQ